MGYGPSLVIPKTARTVPALRATGLGQKVGHPCYLQLLRGDGQMRDGRRCRQQGCLRKKFVTGVMHPLSWP